MNRYLVPASGPFAEALLSRSQHIGRSIDQCQPGVGRHVGDIGGQFAVTAAQIKYVEWLAIGQKVTVNFEHAGKKVIDGTRVELVLVMDDGT